MLSRSKRIISFSVLVALGLLLFVLAFFPDFSYNTIKSLLRINLNTEKWFPVIGKLLLGISFIFFAFAFAILFFPQLQNLYKEHNILFYAISFFIIALICRFAGFGFESGDYKGFLEPWFNTFKANRIEAIRTDVGDYTVIYKYFILIFTFIPINPLYSYKLLSITFDFLLAIYSGLFIHKITGSKIKALLGYAVVLFLPNFILNSSVWGQCDSIFSFFILLSCYYLYLKKERKCIIYFTIAFCFKIQAVFFLPVLIVYLMEKKLNIKSLIWFPVVYLIVILPSILCGMSPFYALFGAYLKQTTEYPSINFNAANLYMIFSNGFLNQNINFLLIGLTLGLCAVIAFIFTNDKDDKPQKLILLSYLFTLIVPFTLPHMHERYFYLSEVFAILFAFTFSNYYYISIITIFSSLPELIQFLFGINSNVNLVFMGYLMFIGILLLFRVVHKEIRLEINKV